MSLIKFPSHIKPARVTVALNRVDERPTSPLTNIQQVVARGNPAWRWTYEFVDLSDSERDIVQAFLMKCKGSVNAFKVSDPGDYEIKGGMSDWIDLFRDHGTFAADAGSSTIAVNSWFSKINGIDHHITDDRSLRLTRTIYGSNRVQWKGDGVLGGYVASLEIGKTYVQRSKYFADKPDSNHCYQPVGSGGTETFITTGMAGTTIKSSDLITSPFLVPSDISSITLRINGSTLTGGQQGAWWEHADYQCIRAAMVCNSENLLTRSNDFSHADWGKGGAVVVESGWMQNAPFTGVTSGGWKMYGNAAVNSVYYLSQAVTKTTTRDLFSFSLYARQDEMTLLRLDLQGNGSGNNAWAFFYLDSGSYALGPASGEFQRSNGTITHVGSDIYKCTITAYVSSYTTLNAIAYVASGNSVQWTNDGSSGIEIFGGSLRRFPLPGQYVPTTDTAIVGSGWQTGSKLLLDGFDPGDVIKAGQRFEIVNQYHNRNDAQFERSEFKRITRETVVNAEGWADVEFDPPIRNAPVTDRSWASGGHFGETMHNAVIFHKPEMKARLLAGTIQYVDKPLKAMDLTFDVMEDLAE